MPTESGPSGPGDKFDRLVGIMTRLRAPDGCPWDREQSLDTLKKYLVEETYEVIDAIDARDWPALCEELGDLMLQPVFQAQIAAEAGWFSIGDAIDSINEKLVRRHPHIFGDAKADSADDVKHRWDQIKAEEKAARGEAPRLLLDGIPRSQPALSEAQAISVKAAKTGFDWPSKDGVFDKLEEEVRELRAAETPAQLRDELGDILFVVVNLARVHGVDAEQALREANAKFRRRFAHVERALAASGLALEQATLDQMEEKWAEAKRS